MTGPNGELHTSRLRVTGPVSLNAVASTTVFVNGTLVMARFWSAFDAYIVDGIVNGVAALTRFVAWLNGLFDTYIIDGLVNALADVTYWLGNRFRRLQTGNINGYLYGIIIAMAVAVFVKVRYWS